MRNVCQTEVQNLLDTYAMVTYFKFDQNGVDIKWNPVYLHSSMLDVSFLFLFISFYFLFFAFFCMRTVGKHRLAFVRCSTNFGCIVGLHHLCFLRSFVFCVYFYFCFCFLFLLLCIVTDHGDLMSVRYPQVDTVLRH